MAKAASRAFWGCAWGDWAEENGMIMVKVEIMDVMPDVPDKFKAFGKRFVDSVMSNQTDRVFIAARIMDNTPATEDCGHYLAMESMGHGVAWMDKDHGVDVPRCSVKMFDEDDYWLEGV